MLRGSSCMSTQINYICKPRIIRIKHDFYKYMIKKGDKDYTKMFYGKKNIIFLLFGCWICRNSKKSEKWFGYPLPSYL
jgi:hypothetical protein